jgi:hypothetical protein
MKVLVISDPHLGHPGWNGFGEILMRKAQVLAKDQHPTVALCVGDLVEPRGKVHLNVGLELFRSIPATFHLWVAGNNDIEWLRDQDQPVNEYADLLDKMARPYGVILLDHEPVIIDQFAFVGNFGYYDLSLWKPSSFHAPQYPSTLESVRTSVEEWHSQELGISMTDLFKMCQGTLRRHLEKTMGKKLVIATHMVPTPEMVLYGSSAAYDYQNAWMGWNDELSERPLHATPGLVLQLCGHTHRSQRIDRYSAPLINASGNEQPLIFDL